MLLYFCAFFREIPHVTKIKNSNLHVPDLRSSVFLDFQGNGFLYVQHYLVALLDLLEVFHLLPHLAGRYLSFGSMEGDGSLRVIDDFEVRAGI